MQAYQLHAFVRRQHDHLRVYLQPQCSRVANLSSQQADSKPIIPNASPIAWQMFKRVVESDDAINPFPLNGRLTFELQPEFGKERNGGLEVFDNDGHIVHS